MDIARHLLTMNDAECYEDTPELAKFYSEHGPVCSLLGFYRRANLFSGRSLEIRRKMKDVWGEGQTLSYSSVVSLAECKFEECVQIAMEGVRVARQDRRRLGNEYGALSSRQCVVSFRTIPRSGRAGQTDPSLRYRDRRYTSLGELASTSSCAPGRVWFSPAVVEAQAAIPRTDAQSHAQTQIAMAMLRIRQQRFEDACAIMEESISRCRKASLLNWLCESALRLASHRAPPVVSRHPTSYPRLINHG